MNIDVHGSSFTGIFKLLMDKVGKDFECCLPAIVTKVTDRNLVDVMPMVKYIDLSGKSIKRSVVPNAKVVNFGTKEFVLSFPIKKDDIGLLIACDRDISLVIQSKDISDPATARKHDFSDSFFIPLSFNDFKPKDEDKDSTVIYTKDGSKFCMTTKKLTARFETIDLNTVTIDDKGNIHGPSNITNDGDFLNKGNVEIDKDIKAKGKLDVDKDITAKSKLEVDKDITAKTNITVTGTLESQNISADASLKVGGKEVLAHIHPTTNPGSPTGPMS